MLCATGQKQKLMYINFSLWVLGVSRPNLAASPHITHLSDPPTVVMTLANFYVGQSKWIDHFFMLSFCFTLVQFLSERTYIILD